MNILLINHYAGSLKHGMEFRPWYMAKKWIEAGHNVSILSASYAHTRKKQPKVTKDLETQNIDGVEYIYLKTPPYHGNGIKRIINMFSFTYKLIKYSKKLSKIVNPDIVIASSTYPLDNYYAKRIADLSKGKYIYEIHDLWPLSPMELGGYSPKHPFIQIMQRAENFAYKNCDAVVSILPCVKDHVTSKGLPAEKLHIVENGIWSEDWMNAESAPENHIKTIQNIKSEGNICIGYTGAHGVANQLNDLIDCAEILKSKSIHFFLIGDGPEKATLIELSKSKELTNITFLDSIAKTQIPSILNEFDILYVGMKRERLYRFGVGLNKLFDYMMAGKPIVSAIEAGNDIVGNAKCGYNIEPENPQVLADAFVKMINITDEEKKAFGENGKNYVMKHHEYQSLSDKFLNIMKGLIKE